MYLVLVEPTSNQEGISALTTRVLDKSVDHIRMAPDRNSRVQWNTQET